MMKQVLERWLLNVWYGDGWLGKYLLLPLTGVFCLLSALNRQLQRCKQVKHAVPVIVVGNISVGGTGKTPLVIWLVEHLRAMGFKPGVVSRGYGVTLDKGGWRDVSANASASEIGDEPLLIVQRTNAPLVIGKDRNQAISRLLDQYACNIIVADDGLQHYRMGRDLEICVVDGQRRFGNGLCLPAGPLRESLSRLSACDVVAINGENMHMRGDTLINLATGERKLLQTLTGQSVRVVTGIGNPQRFIHTLEQAGLQVVPCIYPDHHAFSGKELHFGDTQPILMTEKDAVKCRPFANPQCWYLPVEAALDAELTQTLLTHLQGFHHGQEIAGNSGLPRDQRAADL